ncbi:hypothetical protein [Methylobacterium brachiatum]|uniref:hypothetical protein n=1 Tax=Methylobacterium brachiatum TaxID=269660 RepID=UPI0013CE93D8|nr:hypothetical protein [Methylobacterium brachiatum]
MIRHRWIRAQWPIDMRTLASRLGKLEYKSDAQAGFILGRARADIVEGRFVERVSVSERVVNPFGGEQLFDRVEFRIAEFRATDGDHGLEIINPPRSTTMFLNHLSEACDDALALEAMDINPLLWGASISDQLGEQCRFLSLQLSKLSLSETVSAQIVLNGTSDVRPYLEDLTRGRKFLIDKVKIEIGEKRKHSVILGRQATVSSSQFMSPTLLHIIRSTIARARS